MSFYNNPFLEQAKYERSLQSCEGCQASQDNATLVYDSGKVSFFINCKKIIRFDFLSTLFFIRNFAE